MERTGTVSAFETKDENSSAERTAKAVKKGVNPIDTKTGKRKRGRPPKNRVLKND